MDGQAEIGTEALTHRRLTGHAKGQVGGACVGRRRLEGGASLGLGQTGGALQRLGRAVQMTGAVAADIDLNAQAGGWRRGRDLPSPRRGRKQKRQRKKKAGRCDRGYARAARPRRLAPERA